MFDTPCSTSRLSELLGNGVETVCEQLQGGPISAVKPTFIRKTRS
jgi:hypothetical protein